MSALPRHELLERVSSLPFQETDQSATARLFRTLVTVHPAQITGKNLAERLGLTGHAHAALCFHFHRANEALAPHGLAVVRSGGQPHSTYWIRPV